MKHIVRLYGINVNLCVVRTDDEAIDLYTQWMNDENINMYIGKNSVISPRIEQEKWANRECSDDDCRFCIVEKKSDKLIGTCSLSIRPNARNASLGICIGDPACRNRGYGTEVVKLLIKFAFYEQNMHRVELFVNAENDRAIDCYKKAGFKIVGTMHDADYYHGHYCDVHVMEILEDEYNKIMEDIKSSNFNNDMIPEQGMFEQMIELEELSEQELKQLRRI